MITLKDFMEVTDCRITEGSDYSWSCYGTQAFTLDSWNGLHDGGHSMSVTFDTETQEVYEITVCTYKPDRAYRYINPNYLAAFKEEEKNNNTFTEAWDDVRWIDLEVPEDFLEKARAIFAGEEYDARVQLPLILDREDMFDLMRIAHEQDITLNELVEHILRDAIDQTKFLDDWK
ncbi:hypothetical protein [Lake Baikal phage Baikal-20-5m-C28]|nr:hypothetical protein [Lake Baikal phage Baikal-20-5m-C28]